MIYVNSFYCKIDFVFQNQEKIDFQMFVLQWHVSKNTFTPNSSNQNDFFRQLGGQNIFFSTFGQNMSFYGQIWLPK